MELTASVTPSINLNVGSDSFGAQNNDHTELTDVLSENIRLSTNSSQPQPIDVE